VRVPEEVGRGDVRITLSFPNWKEGRVAPATFRILAYEEPAAEGKQK
jgi:hypothetical protein